MSGFFAWYQATLEVHPLSVTMGTTAVMNGLGDAIAQALERKLRYDTRRTLLLVLWGMFVYAPIALIWYSVLERAFPGFGAADVAAKVVLDQTIWASGCISALFVFSSLTRGESANAARAKLERDLWPTLRVNWLVWPAVQTFNMAVVSPMYRIVLILIVQVPWTAYLALQAAAGSKEAAAPATGPPKVVAAAGGSGKYQVLEEGTALVQRA
jgi:protein Mpv17